MNGKNIDSITMNTMAAPRPRKRLSKMRRGAAVIGCCVAVATATASAASTVVANFPHVKVEPNNIPRKDEKRRRLEQDYYRSLDSSQKQQQRRRLAESRGEADASTSVLGGSHIDHGRRLPASVHKKGNKEVKAQTAVHKKGNEDSSTSEDEPISFMTLGGNGQSSAKNNDPPPTSTSSAAAAAEDPPPPPPPPSPPAQTNNNKGDIDDDGLDQRLATNLRKFTRIGGRGYSLPPEKRFPYMASLQLEGHAPTSGQYDIHMCGGILVAPDLVMSAAHCANYSPPGTDETYQAFNGIEIGKSDLSDEGANFDPYSLETYRLYYENLVPEKVHIHPRFDEDTYENDVMLVKVFGMSRFPTVKLAENNPNDPNIVVLGWGAPNAQSTKKFSDKLRSAEMDLLRNEDCKNVNVEVTDPTTSQSSIMSLREHVFDDMMCAKSNQRHICFGDAGGPAIAQGNNNDEDEVYGILSWGYGCVNKDYPAVMARVPDHFDWIRRMICRESSDPPEQYGCPKTITAFSSGTVPVTLKLKMDMMAVETGFVVEVKGTGEIVAQRQTGYYKSEKWGNEIVLEEMDLPANTCFNLVLLDSFGDGMCCDMGGGNADMFWGTDTSYYSGQKLAEINGSFEFDSSAEFCTSAPVNSIQVVSTDTASTHGKGQPPSPDPPPSPPIPNPPRTRRPTNMPTKRPTRKPTKQPINPNPTPSGNGNGNGGNGDNGNGSNGDNNHQGGHTEWSGPVMNPEFSYCTQFCSSGSDGMMCGKYECVHIPGEIATSDADQSEEGGSSGSGGGSGGGDEDDPDEEDEDGDEEGGDSELPDQPLVSTEFYDDESDYYLTVQFQFDDHPEEISWVLYDLTLNEVKVFIDFDEYPREEFANQLLSIVVTMDGPDEGEKNYAFTVYDQASNGLCCEHGEGWYKVFLGDTDDDLELMGDNEFDFSSSYYFTLFEMESQLEEVVTDTPTLFPTKKPTKTPSKNPTKRPTKRPSKSPSKSPTKRPTKTPNKEPTTGYPTFHPITARPTEPWERRRPEDSDAIGARWNTRINTPHGVFTDIGGDQNYYRFDADGTIKSGASSRDSLCRRGGGGIVVSGMVLISSIVLAIMH